MATSKREYRLESVRKIREKYRDDAAVVVKNCLGEVEYSKLLISQTSHELEKKRKQVETFDWQIEESALEGISAGELKARREFLKSLRKQRDAMQALLSKQEVELIERENRLAAARETLNERIRDLKVVEKHAENFEKSLKEEKKRRNQRIDDEIALNNHQNRE